MTLSGSFYASGVHGPMALASAPFLYSDLDHWRRFRDSDLYGGILAEYEGLSGNQVLGLMYYGARHLTANREITSPEDMDGLKLRVPNAPMYLLFPRSVNANATPIDFAEVYLALQQGVVDAQENPLPTIQAKKFHEVQTDINLTGHITDALLTIIGGPTWGGMDEADRDALIGVLQEAAVCATDQIIDLENELAAWFKEQGNNVNEVDRGPFIEAVRAVHNGEMATWDQATYDALQAIQ